VCPDHIGGNQLPCARRRKNHDGHLIEIECVHPGCTILNRFCVVLVGPRRGHRCLCTTWFFCSFWEGSVATYREGLGGPLPNGTKTPGFGTIVRHRRNFVVCGIKTPERWGPGLCFRGPDGFATAVTVLAFLACVDWVQIGGGNTQWMMFPCRSNEEGGGR